MSWYKIRENLIVVEKLEDGQTKVIVSTITDISCQIMPQMFHISNQSIPKLCSINTAKLYVIVRGTHIVSSLFLSWSSRQYNTLQLQFLPNAKTHQGFDIVSNLLLWHFHSLIISAILEMSSNENVIST